MWELPRVWYHSSTNSSFIFFQVFCYPHQWNSQDIMNRIWEYLNIVQLVDLIMLFQLKYIPYIYIYIYIYIYVYIYVCVCVCNAVKSVIFSTFLVSRQLATNFCDTFSYAVYLLISRFSLLSLLSAARFHIHFEDLFILFAIQEKFAYRLWEWRQRRRALWMLRSARMCIGYIIHRLLNEVLIKSGS